MSLTAEQFYELSPPRFPQQGDIYPNTPLISLPPSKELVVIREAETEYRLDALETGTIEAMRESVLVDAFLDGSSEYILVSAVRTAALLLTQTCDLADNDHWLVAPMHVLEGESVDRGNLFAGKYPNILGLPEHPHRYFEESYADLGGVRAVRRESLDLADRVASLSLLAQIALTDKLGENLGRRWGYAEGEQIPKDGWYRCHRCNLFLVENPNVEFKAGKNFPDCKNCQKINKRSQWYQVLKHRKY